MVDFETYCSGFTFTADDVVSADASGMAAICSAQYNIDLLAADLATANKGVDTFFLLFSAALVFLMQSGFAMLCAGSVRQKNVKNIMFKNLLDACGGAIGFWSVGWAFAYGDPDTTVRNFIGSEQFFLKGDFSAGTLIGWFFQFAFAATAATIVAGTVAERCKMQAYLCYSLMLTGFVYPVVVHSVWSPCGFLSAFGSAPKFLGSGVYDFAGSGVVHMTGGVTALIAAKVLGPRIGRFYDADGNVLDEPHSFPPHSVALQVLGTFLLWFGWYGFNPGSALAITPAGYADVAALCAVTTTIAAASGCVTSCFTDMLLNRMSTGETEYDVGMAMNGALGGLVGITAGCSIMTPGFACVVGIIAGWVYLAFSKFLVKMRIDDAVDAVPVHFACGVWGVFAVGLLAHPTLVANVYGEGNYGLFYGGGGKLLGAQCTSIVWVIGWVSVIMIPFFVALKSIGMFRVDALEEEVGLDISHHKGSAYDLSAAKKEDVEELVAQRSVHGKGGVSVPGEEAA